MAADALDEVRAAWEQFRAACFLRPGPGLIWVWTAAHEFDFAIAGLHLGQVPDARFDLGTHAIALVLPHLRDPQLHEWHLVPIPRITKPSLESLSSVVDVEGITSRAQTLLAEERAAQEALDRRVQQAHLWRLLPGSAHGLSQ